MLGKSPKDLINIPVGLISSQAVRFVDIYSSRGPHGGLIKHCIYDTNDSWVLVPTWKLDSFIYFGKADALIWKLKCAAGSVPDYPTLPPTWSFVLKWQEGLDKMLFILRRTDW